MGTIYFHSTKNNETRWVKVYVSDTTADDLQILKKKK